MSKLGMALGDLTCSQSLCPCVKFDRLHSPSAGYCLVCGVADSEDGRGGRGGGRTRGMTRAGSHLGESSSVRVASKRIGFGGQSLVRRKTAYVCLECANTFRLHNDWSAEAFS